MLASYRVKRSVMRVSVALLLLFPAGWLNLRLWGIADASVAHVSDVYGPEAPTSLYRAEYGYFRYLAVGTAFHGHRPIPAPNSDQAHARTVTQRKVHWAALVETIASSLAVIGVFAGAVLWAWRAGRPPRATARSGR